jgi:DNA polymerase-3 subunit alpha
MPGGEDLLLRLRDLAPTYLEIMPHAHPKQKAHNLRCLELSRKYNIPLVATNDCHWPYAGMEETQEVLLAMQRKAKWSDPDRWHMRDWPGLHLRSNDEMAEAFTQQGCLDQQVWIDAMHRTMEVAGLCNGYTVERMPVELPRVHGHGDRNETDLMWEIISDGWNRRIISDSQSINQLGLKKAIWKPDYAIYEARVQEEFDLICRQGFQRYFLIVWELISFCRQNGIMVGPGRGSSGGSLVAYLMGITDVDPIRYGLIFARFISPERCFIEGTEVIVNDKLNYIENINKGDIVINKYGEIDNVKAIHKYRVNKKLLKIHFNGRHEICSPNHTWIVYNEQGNIVEKQAKDLIPNKDKLISIK